jgi:hypothetical protein
MDSNLKILSENTIFICLVATKWVGTLCQFPFTRLGITFNTCTAQWGLAPQCLDTTGAWATCDG